MAPRQEQPRICAAASATHALTLTLLAFVFHYAWENAQCRAFYEHGSFDPTQWGMMQASLGDVVITWGLYGIVAGFSRSWRWASAVWTPVQWLPLLAAALLIGIGVEWHALDTGRWSYTSAAPLIPVVRVSMLPLLQLILVPSVVFYLSERINRRSPRPSETEVTRNRYNRIAPIYDAIEFVMELRFRSWRQQLWADVGPGSVLEVGMGTGKNLRFWPSDSRVTGTDLSEGMLDRARRKARKLGMNQTFEVVDVQALPYEDESFDVVIGTFLFCSVPDPVVGLREILRVLKPGGRLLLLEHVVSKKRVARWVQHWLDPIPYHVWGAHIDRDTIANTKAAGFVAIVTKQWWLDVVVRITATKPREEPGRFAVCSSTTSLDLARTNKLLKKV